MSQLCQNKTKSHPDMPQVARGCWPQLMRVGVPAGSRIAAWRDGLRQQQGAG
jgi:hypothetical protein